MTGNNPQLDLVNVNVPTKFGRIQSGATITLEFPYITLESGSIWFL